MQNVIRPSYPHQIVRFSTAYLSTKTGGKNDNVEITTEFLLLVGQPSPKSRT